MSLPNLPTDNLYKFMALSGVVIILFSNSFAWIQYRSIQEQITELRIELNVHQAVVNELKDKISFLKTKSPYANSKEDKLEISAEWEEIDPQVTIVAKTQAMIDGKIEALKVRNVQIRWISAFAVICTGVGSFLASYGFRLWYTRVQYYHDIILVAEATTAAGKDVEATD